MRSPVNYSKRSLVGKAAHDLLFLLLLSRIPHQLAHQLFVLGSPERDGTKAVSETAGTWQALELLYTFPDRSQDQKRWAEKFWWQLLDNARAIRNRLLLVKQEVEGAARETAGRGETVRLASIGAGSARPILLALKELGDTLAISLLVDQNSEALDFSVNLARNLGINHTNHKTGEFLTLLREIRRFAPNIVEMVGLLDYLDDRQTMVFLRAIKGFLSNGGTFITGNIRPNPERPFVYKAIRWRKMHYRTEEELKFLLREAGFEPKIIREPLGIHTIAVCRVPSHE